MSKEKHPKKGSFLFKLWKAKHFAYVTTVTFLFVFVWWLVGLHYASHHGEQGSYQNTPVARQFYYKSLDLRLVKQADFTSPAIKKAKELSQANGVRRIIFSYAVPHDNLTEKGLMTLPASSEPADGYPVIILCHGYVNPYYYSTEEAYLSDMVFYSQHGFAVLKPDFRGQGLSLDAGQPEGAYYSTAYNTDVMSLIGAIKKTSYLNKNNINIWGHSMGAYIALRAAVVSPDIKNTILLSGPVGRMEDMYSMYVAISDTNNPTAANIKLNAIDLYGTPITNPDFWKYVSPLSYLDQTKTYFQIHVGLRDETVPPRLSADLDQALSEAGKKHDYYVYPTGRHGLVPERPQIHQRSLEKLEQ